MLPHSPKIKMCGFTSPLTAAQAIELGVDFIGLVFHPTSSRCVTVEIAHTITRLTQGTRTRAVGVFVDQDAAQITKICTDCNLDIVQLHGSALQAVSYLPSELIRIIAVNLPASPKRLRYPIPHTINFRVDQDFMLFDSAQSGSGKVFNQATFLPPSDARFFIAGGLHPLNVTNVIKRFRPDGVDVSSGVEKVRGEKDKSLMQQFVSAVRNTYA